MRNFRNLQVWKNGMDIAVDVYQFSFSLPDYEKFGIANQIRRSARSIPSNIAEGAAKSSQRDYKRFLEIAWGSANELETDLILLQRIGLGEQEAINKILSNLELEQQKINVLIQKVKANPN